MSTNPTAPPAQPHPPRPSPGHHQIKVISHSSLFYWWPIWAFSFFCAAWTYVENHRMAIVPADSRLLSDGGDTVLRIPGEPPRLWKDVATDDSGIKHPKARVTAGAWMGPTFCILLLLVIVITNVPLRGLWSIVAIISIALLSLIFTLLGWWEDIFRGLGNLHIYINMAGYLFLGTVLIIIWALSIYLFDRRTYIIFTPRQVRVCEEIGGREKVYDTMGMTVEKHRDDLFRHWVLGFGSGDLTVRTSGADRHEIILPNVLAIGWKLKMIEDMVRETPTVKG